ncbi:hypothetical protein M404DRAFT_735019 [Pisolithus tinctorius Marx 270]|uniref:Uncharacterized protein n=1 Tax=Pisolithus tinctorius Marx 270 TaxID=870435 RepID=A0A0C3P2D1_PISTI|nr:hypothetical protein M404DRAFT_735019 [Pisolithus tinctorius Marx 270]
MSDDIAQALAYIESATLNPIQVGLYSRAAVLSENKDRGKYLGEPGQDGAATVGGTLVSVLANLTGQNRTDVANSLEFASRVAAKEVGADDHTAAYWNAFKTSIFQIGWFKQADEWSSDFIDGTTTGAENFSDYVIDNAEKRAFFRSFTAGGDKGSFGVNSATVTNGALAMRFSAFTFSCNAKVDDYLIFSIKNIKANVQKDNVDAAANQRTIDSVRQKIEDKLDKAAGDYIDGVDI